MRSRRRLILVAGSLFLLGSVAAAVHVGRSAVDLQQALETARTDARAAVDAIAGGDIQGARDATDRLVRVIAPAVPDDPVWSAAEGLPGVGANLSAVRRAATAMQRVGEDVAPPLLDTARRMRDADAPAAVGILRDGASALDSAAAVRREVSDDIGSIDRSALLPSLADGIDEVAEAIDRLEPATDGAAQAAAVLPGLLGADGERRILVMVQNPAELRTGGGITGTFLELRARDGRLTLGAQRDSSDFAPVATPLVPVADGEVHALGDGIGRFVQNASMTADFTVTARLASAWWQRSGMPAPDAVVSVDPVVLAAVLGVTGPVQTRGGELDQRNVVDRLLVEPYRTLGQDAQSRWFADAAVAVFSAVTERARPVSLVTAVSGVVAEGRVSVWSRHPDEQSILTRTPLAGPLARQDAAGPTAFAAYFNDATGGKLTPYLSVGLGVRSGVCRADGLREVAIEVDLASTLTPQEGETLPISVTGGGIFGATKGFIAPTVTVVAPPGWYLGGLTLDGRAVPSADALVGERASITRRVDIPPGDGRDLVFRFVAGPEVPSEASVPTLLHTPLLGPVDVRSGAVSCPKA
ncbi:DUF4012 domain-containing protein [Microbacterium oleivorans]|uniref:DUF4012 domain-containing protein n=1 Tax=Microbacterium oleivorans TaxID=273677 RepID=UPI00080E0FE5|nr:DUF4012 domain-containing protein [Microbacterium oleivorans]